MGLISRLNGDVQELNKRYLTASPSIRKRLISDYEYADSLADTLGIKLDIPKYSVKIDDSSLFLNQVDMYLYDMEKIADVVISMFREMEFYFFKRFYSDTFTKRDVELLMKEFLDYFLSDLYKIYLDFVKDDRIIITDLGSNLGESFFLNQLDSYYMALNEKKNVNYMLLFETIVHELVHIY